MTSTDYLFYSSSEFEAAKFKGYPTHEWLLEVSQRQFSQGQYTIHFSHQSAAEFIRSSTADEIDYIYADDSLESINSNHRAQLRFPIVSSWNTQTECLTLAIEETVTVEKPVKGNEIVTISRGTYPVFVFDPNTTTTALTRAGLQREMEIVTEGDWFIAQAALQPGNLKMYSSTNTLSWVSSSDVLLQNEVLSQPIQISKIETSSEYIILNFEETVFNTEGMDYLVTDFFLYQANRVAFNFHIPVGSAPLETVQPRINLNWSDFDKSSQTEIIII